MKALMATPNICEGRNLQVVEQVCDAIRTVAGVKLIDVSSDENHNRSVLTYLGEVGPVLEASRRMALTTLEQVDMRLHHGAHPRVGAVDAVPFIPVRGMEMTEAVEAAHDFGRFLGEHGVPVWYYGAADTNHAAGRPAGTGKLTQELLGGYEGLPVRLQDPSWPPDEGPTVFNPMSGASTVGARSHLVCFNVNLRTTDVAIARRIAKAVRHSSGGYQDVQAIGLALESRGLVQVSMMTTRAIGTPLPRLLETIRFEAARDGVAVCETEINGPIPLSALEEVFRHYLQSPTFKLDQIIETALID